MLKEDTKMSENMNVNFEEINEGIADAANAADNTNFGLMGEILSGAAGGIAGFFGGREAGYNAAVKDVAKAINAKPSDLKKLLKKKEKEEKAAKKGGLKIRNPFYREEVQEEVKVERPKTKRQQPKGKTVKKETKGKKPKVEAE